MNNQIFVVADLSDLHISNGFDLLADVVIHDGYSEKANAAHFGTKACFDRDYSRSATRRTIVSLIAAVLS